MPTYHLIVKGTVQGVFYRATAKKVADDLGVTGWVRNTADDNVEAVVSGTEEQLQEFISWCKRGPEHAHVKDVVISKRDETIFDEFVVKR